MMWLLMLVLFISLLRYLTQRQHAVEDISYYPVFHQMVTEGKVSKVTIVRELSGRQYVEGESKEVDERTDRPKRFRTTVAAVDDLKSFLVEHEVETTVRYPSPYLMQFLSTVLPFLLILALLYYFFARKMSSMGKGAMSFGKSRAKLLNRDRNKVTFADVAGVDEAREEVAEIVQFLQDPKKFQKLGGRIPKGVLLVGPPGTGKTLIAKAIAGEAEVPFFSISGSDFVEMFVGVGASRVRDMFEQGKRNAPCIIFVDEIDAVGRSRFSGIGGGHDEREQTLNAILVEMDGFDTTDGVIMLAATNRPDVLDTALLRPGRFDRQIYVDLPSLEGRIDILRIHSKRIKLADDTELHRVARGTPGFSGADLANLINEAALLAARRGAETVELQDLEEARDKVCWGRERRSRVLDDEEKRLTAFHEAGHAVVLHHTKGCDPLHKVTIIPRGRALGATMQLPEKDRYTQSYSKLTGMIIGMMGGRVAEELVFDEVTTGAQSDFKQATHIARMMVTEFGMSPVLGPQNFSEHEELMFLAREVSKGHSMSEETARKIDSEVSRILTECHDRAMEVLSEHREMLDVVAEMLIERETLEGEDVSFLLDNGRMPTDEEKTAARAHKAEKRRAEEKAAASKEKTQANPEESVKDETDTEGSSSGKQEKEANHTETAPPADDLHEEHK